MGDKRSSPVPMIPVRQEAPSNTEGLGCITPQGGSYPAIKYNIIVISCISMFMYIERIVPIYVHVHTVPETVAVL